MWQYKKYEYNDCFYQTYMCIYSNITEVYCGSRNDLKDDDDNDDNIIIIIIIYIMCGPGAQPV